MVMDRNGFFAVTFLSLIVINVSNASLLSKLPTLVGVTPHDISTTIHVSQPSSPDPVPVVTIRVQNNANTTSNEITSQDSKDLDNTTSNVVDNSKLHYRSTVIPNDYEISPEAKKMKPRKPEPEPPVLENCTGAISTCTIPGSLVACIINSDTGSTQSVMIVENEGEDLLKVNITAPSLADHAMLEMTKHKKFKVHLSAGKTNKVILSSGKGECVLYLDTPASPETTSEDNNLTNAAVNDSEDLNNNTTNVVDDSKLDYRSTIIPNDYKISPEAKNMESRKPEPEPPVLENCEGAISTCTVPGSLVACIISVDTGSKQSVMIVENEGEDTLNVNLTAPNLADHAMLEMTKHKKLKINLGAVSTNEVILSSGIGDCVLYLDPSASNEKASEDTKNIPSDNNPTNVVVDESKDLNDNTSNVVDDSKLHYKSTVIPRDYEISPEAKRMKPRKPKPEPPVLENCTGAIMACNIPGSLVACIINLDPVSKQSVVIVENEGEDLLNVHLTAPNPMDNAMLEMTKHKKFKVHLSAGKTNKVILSSGNEECVLYLDPSASQETSSKDSTNAVVDDSNDNASKDVDDSKLHYKSTVFPRDYEISPEAKKLKPRKPKAEPPVLENCTGAIRTCTFHESLVACIINLDTGSRQSVMIVQNEGEDMLSVNLTAPNPADNALLEMTKHKKLKVNLSAGKTNEVTLTSGNGTCVLHLDPSASHESSFLHIPSYDKLITPVNGAYFLILTVLVFGGMWACYTIRKTRRHGGFSYQEVEMGLPESNNVKTGDGWDRDWDEDWDEENGVRSPRARRAGSISANGLTARSANRDG